MKKYVLTLGLVLASPLLLAQSTDDPRPADPATPATPATPAMPGGSDESPLDVQAPTTDEEGTTSGSVRGQGQGLRGSANPEQGTGGVAGSSSSDFGTLDANGDGKLSRDEVGARAGLSFKDMDSNSDGSVSRAEYSTGLKARPGEGAAKSRKSKGRTEGSDRTDTDDELDRRLN